MLQIRENVFISYSHKDRKWLEKLQIMLTPLVRKGMIKTWSDTQIEPGTKWQEEINKALAAAKVAVLLITPNFLASDFITKHELPPLLKTAKEGGLIILWIAVSASMYEITEIVGYQAVNDPSHPLDSLKPAHQSKELVQICKQIKNVVVPEHAETGYAFDIHPEHGMATPTRGKLAHASKVPFQAGGPLPNDASVYIKRKADQDILDHLRRMDYISLIEPRLQGKTSLIYRLMHEPSLRGYVFVICDLSDQRFCKGSEPEWYRALGVYLWHNLKFVSDSECPPLPIDSTSWQTFLADISEAAKHVGQKVVIVLDEIREMPSAFATSFFTVIRIIYNQRALHTPFEYLTFIISGAFNPSELILDENISKFNVDQRIHLDDFDLPQVRQLVAHLPLSDGIVDSLAQRVHYWANGQPYLTQRLCFLLSSQQEFLRLQKPDDVVDRVAKQLYEDPNYLHRIKNLRKREPDLFQYAQRIISGYHPLFNQALSDEHFKLAHIYGVIKADVDGICQIRNRICQYALRHIDTQPLY